MTCMRCKFGIADATTNNARAATVPQELNNLVGDQELHMFDGKNNRLLDSFSFRVALTVVVFALWSGAGYALLSLL